MKLSFNIKPHSAIASQYFSLFFEKDRAVPALLIADSLHPYNSISDQALVEDRLNLKIL